MHKSQKLLIYFPNSIKIWSFPPESNLESAQDFENLPVNNYETAKRLADNKFEFGSNRGAVSA